MFVTQGPPGAGLAWAPRHCHGGPASCSYLFSPSLGKWQVPSHLQRSPLNSCWPHQGTAALLCSNSCSTALPAALHDCCIHSSSLHPPVFPPSTSLAAPRPHPAPLGWLLGGAPGCCSLHSSMGRRHQGLAATCDAFLPVGCSCCMPVATASELKVTWWGPLWLWSAVWMKPFVYVSSGEGGLEVEGYPPAGGATADQGILFGKNNLWFTRLVKMK